MTERRTPRRSGHRWPAEWEPHAATWLSWPHNAETWPGRLAAVEAAFVDMVAAIAPGERVAINVLDAEMGERVQGLLRERDASLDTRVDLHAIATDDAWVRDHGPLFLVAAPGAPPDAPPLVAIDFEFDAWGGKYPPWDRDAKAARRMAAAAGVPCLEAGLVLEPGAVDGNGAGGVLTTESCLLHPNRGRDGQARSREALERALGDWLVADRVVWLGDGIAGDDTDGHVDDLTRFVARDVVVTAVEADPADENHAPLADNLARLHALRRSAWPGLEIVELPMPAPCFERGERLPASHANLYIANAAVLVPVFGGESDARALAVLADCFPGREVVGIPSRDLVVGLGAAHCLTQQQPAAPVAAGAADPGRGIEAEPAP